MFKYCTYGHVDWVLISKVSIKTKTTTQVVLVFFDAVSEWNKINHLIQNQQYDIYALSCDVKFIIFDHTIVFLSEEFKGTM